MQSRTSWFFMWFPALLGAPLAAQRLGPVDRQLIAAGMWAEARYNYAYWDAVRASWDSAFTATVTYANGRPTELQFLRQLRRWGALLNDGQFDIIPPAAVAARMARPPIELRSIERRPFIIDYANNDEMRVARPTRLGEIVAVQGIPAALWSRDSLLAQIAARTEASRWERAVAQMLEGIRGTALHLQLKLPGGEPRGASVTRSVAINARWPIERPALEADTLPDGALWMRINSLAEPDVVSMFDRALGNAPREGPRHRGLILDLRETTWTPGGREQGYAILSRLIERLVDDRPSRYDLAAPAARTHRLQRTGRGPVVTANRGRRGRPACGVPEQRAGVDHRRAVGGQHGTDRPAQTIRRLATARDGDPRRLPRRLGV